MKLMVALFVLLAVVYFGLREEKQILIASIQSKLKPLELKDSTKNLLQEIRHEQPQPSESGELRDEEVLHLEATEDELTEGALATL